MRQDKWDRLLNDIEEEERDLLFVDVVDEIFNNGLKKLHRFYVIVIGYENEPLERHQFEIIQECMVQILEWVYGIEYYGKHRKRIKKLCRFSHELSCVLSVIKRQYGKTETLVRVVVASGLSFPNMDIVDESTGKRIQEFAIKSFIGSHARGVLQRCYEFMEKRPELLVNFYTDGKKIKTNTTIRLTNMFDKNDVRVLRAYEENITGLSKKKFFFDEFFKCKNSVTETQLAPQLQVKGTSGFFFSTLENSEHWCMRWLNKKQTLVKVMDYADICPVCLKLPPNEAIECKHGKKLQAHWIDPIKRARVMSIMTKDEMFKEMLNVVPGSTNQLWKKDYLEQNLLGVSRNPEEYFDEYHMFVDPSMTSKDGSWSGTTIIGEDSKGNTQICYLNTNKTESSTLIVNYIISDIKHFVKNFIEKYTPKKRKWYIILYVEHNTYNHGYEIFLQLQKDFYLSDRVIFIKNIEYKKEDKEYGRFGVTKKSGDEERFANLLGYKMLKFEMFSHPKCCTRNSMGIDEIKRILVEQCTHVKKMAIETKTGVKTVIVSTRNFNNKSSKNDLYMSLVSAIYNTQKTKNSENTSLYIQYANRMTVRKFGYYR